MPHANKSIQLYCSELIPALRSPWASFFAVSGLAGQALVALRVAEASHAPPGCCTPSLRAGSWQPPGKAVLHPGTSWSWCKEGLGEPGLRMLLPLPRKLPGAMGCYASHCLLRRRVLGPTTPCREPTEPGEGCWGLMCFQMGSQRSLCCSAGTQQPRCLGSLVCREWGPPVPPSLSQCFSTSIYI